MAHSKIIPSFQQAASVKSRHPFLFFHVPKCGGMSLHSSLAVAFQHAVVPPPLKTFFVALLDEVYSNEAKQSLTKYLICLERFGIEQVGGLITSHQPIRILQSAGAPFRLIGVFRENIDRVVSAYSYQCMRRDRIPSQQGFHEFIEDAHNQNVTCKTLLGIHSLETGAGKVAAELVKTQFYAYSMIDSVDLLITSLLSTENLPNVYMTQANSTLSQYKYKLREGDEERIIEFNKEDEAFINGLALDPLRLPNFERNYGLNTETVEVIGEQTVRGFSYASRKVALENCIGS